MGFHRTDLESCNRRLHSALVLSAAALALAAAGALTASTENEGAKALFYEPEEANAKNDGGSAGQGSAAVGLRYWIELEDGTGQVRTVPPSRTFISGERIRIRFQANRAGYVSIFQIPSAGTPAYLFPNPAQGLADNYLQSGTEKTIPSSGWFRFDDEPGTEELLVYFASYQEGLADPRQSLDQDRARQVRTMAEEGGKDLVFEVDADTTYAVNREGEPVKLTIRLQHR